MTRPEELEALVKAVTTSEIAWRDSWRQFTNACISLGEAIDQSVSPDALFWFPDSTSADLITAARDIINAQSD